ncbi:MAG: hypothetical protein Q4F21_00710 [Lachnospiraceae bacterium]|nr:hypothetical protein [Lachnospiraceae bacterium]
MKPITPLSKSERDKLVDISTVEIDRSLPPEERLANYLEQIRNPYCYLCNGIVVHIAYADTEQTIEDKLEHFIRHRQDAEYKKI